MSLTRAALAELCGYVQEKCSTILGNKFWDCRIVIPVDCGTKPDKLEPRIFAISKFRIFILHGKTPSSLKVDRYFHILSIRSVQIINNNELCLGLDESTAGKRRIFVHVDTSSSDLAVHVLSALKHYFPDCAEIIKSLVELTPADLYSSFAYLPCSYPTLACHNFRRSYAALCDFYEQPFREEVVWDVEKIYASHRLRVLRLEDFTHLLPRDLVPILAVCQYSAFFTGICIDGTKLVPELVDVILAVVRRSRTLKTLVLRNCSLPRDFVSLFSSVLQSNLTIPLETLDFSKNVLDDKKGFMALSALLSKVGTLRSLSLSECMLSEKFVNLIAAGLLQAFKPNSGAQQLQLVSLDFSGNALKEDVNDLLQFISLCTSLRTLNLSDTGFNLDKLWGTLRFGGLQLETLRVAGCQCGRRNKDSIQNLKEYFSTAVSLKFIDFSNTTLGQEMLKSLLLGLASNQQLKPFSLLLDAISDRGFTQVLETCLGGVDARYLSLRDNGLEADAQQIISACGMMPHLSRLDLSGSNFSNLKKNTKHHGTLTNVLLEVVKLIGEDDSKLNELVLADCRLGTHLSVLLNTLGVSSSLHYLDITGNEMGNFGARLLAKALQINISLKTVLVDRNQITGDGFTDISNALKLNTSLVSFPYPVNDAADALSRTDRAKTLTALSEIESSVERNRTGCGKGEAHYRTMLTSLQQEMFGKSDGSRKFAEIGEKFSQKLSALSSSGDAEQPLGVLAGQTLQTLEEKISSIAKVALEPFVKIAEAEGLEYSCLLPAQSNLRETLLVSIEDYLNEYKWKTIGGTIEQILVDLRTQNSSDDRRSMGSSHNPSLGSPRDVLSSMFAAQMLHRPKSVICELNSELADRKLSFDTPPLPSPLSHVAKSRPKPSRKHKGAQKRSSSTEEEKESDEKRPSDDDKKSTPELKRSERIPVKTELVSLSRSTTEDKAPVAMPRSTSIQPSLSGHSPTLSSNASGAPPIVPRRNRVGPTSQPPTLPPKPESVSPSLPPKPETVILRPASCGIEDKEEKGRLSVVDMTRMFSSSESPATRRT